MISEERQGELMTLLESYVNRFLDKQCLICDSIDDISEDKEESAFLESCVSYFSVMLPNKEE